MREKNKKEVCPPPSNLPPGNSLQSKMAYGLRTYFSLMMASVLLDIKPWFASCSGSILEIGGGPQPYRHLIKKDCSYQGIDWEKSEECFKYKKAPDTIYYRGDIFPLSDNSFDNLFHTEVLEHIFDLNIFLKECFRVLKSNGAMFFTVPFAAKYHYIPNDYWRFTPASLKKLLEKAGFCDIIVNSRGTDITVMAYKVVSVIYRWLLGNIFAKILGVLCLPVLFIALLIGHLSLRLNFGSSDDCLGYTVTAKVSK